MYLVVLLQKVLATAKSYVPPYFLTSGPTFDHLGTNSISGLPGNGLSGLLHPGGFSGLPYHLRPFLLRNSFLNQGSPNFSNLRNELRLRNNGATSLRGDSTQFDENRSSENLNSDANFNAQTNFNNDCVDGEVPNVDGTCEKPVITKNFFLYAAPPREYEPPAPPRLPKPRVNYNVVFIRNPKQPEDLDPIVIPPPEQKTLVYILNKENSIDQDVIHVPRGPIRRPEVFYINYEEGDNPNLPFGIDFEAALDSLGSDELNSPELNSPENFNNPNLSLLFSTDNVDNLGSNNFDSNGFRSDNTDSNNFGSRTGSRSEFSDYDDEFTSALNPVASRLYGPAKP